MKQIEYGEHRLSILSKQEIENNATEYMVNLKEFKSGSYEWKSTVETYSKVLKEPAPYNLWRYNELTDFSLCYIGCEITEKAYYEALDILPPIYATRFGLKGFFVNECITKNYYQFCFEKENKHYTCIVPINEGYK